MGPGRAGWKIRIDRNYTTSVIHDMDGRLEPRRPEHLFRDPDGHLLELAAPVVWAIY